MAGCPMSRALCEKWDKNGDKYFPRISRWATQSPTDAHWSRETNTAYTYASLFIDCGASLSRWLKSALLAIAGLVVLAAALAAVVSLVTKLPGELKTPSGIRRDTALYIKMRDGVPIAADVWLPQDYQTGQRLPVLIRTTRYGRDGQFGWGFRLLVGFKLTDPHGPGDELTDYLNARHFVVMVTDVRGSGASGGQREIEFSRDEFADLGELTGWATKQPWSNGRIGTFGNSYEADVAELTAAANSSAVKAVVSFSGTFDVGRMLFPGGLYNRGFVQTWNNIVMRLDSGDVCFAEHLSGFRCWWAGRMLRGVKRADEDRGAKQLAAILAQRHNRYPLELLSHSEFRDDPIVLRDGSSARLEEVSAFAHRPEIESSGAAMQVWCGWLDAAVCEGALSRYLTFKNPQQLIMGSFSHELTLETDPFLAANQHSHPDPATVEQHHRMADFFDCVLRPQSAEPIESSIRYETMGEQKWHDTKAWPPTGFESQNRFYLGPEHTLSSTPPTSDSASDSYRVDFTATTGTDNRWFAEVDHDIFYGDRSKEDGRHLIYTDAPLAADVEITGSPVVTLQVASTATDGAFLAYLEDVSPEGHVTLVDDGELRAVTRQLSDPRKLPYAPLGPVSSGSRRDAQPLVPGEAAELKFSMWPTSVVLRKGHQIRLSLAGADADSFPRYPKIGDVTWTVYRQRSRASYLELPLRQR